LYSIIVANNMSRLEERRLLDAGGRGESLIVFVFRCPGQARVPEAPPLRVIQTLGDKARRRPRSQPWRLDASPPSTPTVASSFTMLPHAELRDYNTVLTPPPWVCATHSHPVPARTPASGHPAVCAAIWPSMMTICQLRFTMPRSDTLRVFLRTGIAEGE